MDATTVPEVRWLSDDEQQMWRACLEIVQTLGDVLNRDLMHASELSLPEYDVLVWLSEAPGRRLRMSELAEAMKHSRSRLSHTVSRMERRGLVAREACASDARGVWCLITDDGYDLITRAAPLHVESVRRHLLDPLAGTADLAALFAAVLRLRDHLRSPLERPGSVALDVRAATASGPDGPRPVVGLDSSVRAS